MGAQVSVGGCSVNLPTSGSCSIPWWGFTDGFSYLGSTGNVGMAAPCPLAGTFRNLQVHLDTVPGGTTTRSFTVYLNGTPQSLAVTLGSADHDQLDATHTVTVSPGDLLELRHTLTGTPAGSLAQWSLEFDPTSTTQQVLWAGNHFNSATNTYIPLMVGYFNDNRVTESETYFVAPIAGTIDEQWAHAVTGSVGGAGVGYNLQLRKNAANAGSALACLNGTDWHQTGLGIAFAQGDLLTSFQTRSGAPTLRALTGALVYTPTVPGQVMMGGATYANATNTTLYGPVGELRAAFPAASTTVKGISGPTPWVAGHMSYWLLSAPGSGSPTKSRTAKLYTEGVGALTSAAVISGTATSGFDNVNSDAISASQYLAVQFVPANTPGNSQRSAWSLAQVVPAVVVARLRTLRGVGL